MKLTLKVLICLLLILGIYLWNTSKEGFDIARAYATRPDNGYVIPTEYHDTVTKNNSYVTIVPFDANTKGAIIVMANIMDAKGYTPYFIFGIPTLESDRNGHLVSLNYIGKLLGTKVFPNIVFKYEGCKWVPFYGTCKDGVTKKTDVAGSNCPK